jgi:hypothetical protein
VRYKASVDILMDAIGEYVPKAMRIHEIQSDKKKAMPGLTGSNSCKALYELVYGLKSG